MKTYCVTCGDFCEQKRCRDCFTAWVRGGKNRRVVKTVERGGVRIADIQFESDAPARVCHWCGDPMDPIACRRALLQGIECHTCGECAWLRRSGRLCTSS